MKPPLVRLEDLPKEEFEMRETPMPDGGALWSFEITGRTRDHMEQLADMHGLTLNEWMRYSLGLKTPLAVRVRAAIFPRLYPLRKLLRLTG